MPAIVEAEGWEGPAFQTCVNAANVAEKFETNRRRLDLSFSHHAGAAAFKSRVTRSHLSPLLGEGACERWPGRSYTWRSEWASD